MESGVRSSGRRRLEVIAGAETSTSSKIAPGNAQGAILLVNGSRAAVTSVGDALVGSRFEFERVQAADAVARLAHQSIDLVILDLQRWDERLLDVCRLVKCDVATRFVPVYVIGTKGSIEREVDALQAGADEYLTLPIEARAFQVRLKNSLQRRATVESLDDSENVLISLAQSVEGRDPDLGQHCHRLALMGAAMAISLGLPAPDVFALQKGGYLHDVGKVAVPDNVLFKPGPLTDSEWETMKTHAERGEKICQGMRSLAPVLPIIRHHHERWDGSGYPDGLREEEIPLLARILQMADIFDALTTSRPYKQAMSADEAYRIIRTEEAKGWRDPKLVEAFGDLFPKFLALQVPDDQSAGSLRALAESIEGYRKQSAQEQRRQQPERNKLKLVSGF